MNNRTLVKNLAALPDGPVTVSGWVETVRDQKKVQFVILRDESGAVQLVNPATRELEPSTEKRRRRGIRSPGDDRDDLGALARLVHHRDR